MQYVTEEELEDDKITPRIHWNLIFSMFQTI